jgi:hypothetical protein
MRLFFGTILLTNQYLNLQFTNATVWTAGLSLNELQFPPHSGSNVAAGVGGPITIVFTTPVIDVSGFFTYSSSLTLDAFDALNQSVGTSTSAFSSNFVSSGNPANEMLELSFAGGISRITITGAANGSFVFDDLTIGTATATDTPEPAFLLVCPLALLLMGFFRKRFVYAGSSSSVA